MGKQNQTIRNKRKIGVEDYQNKVVNTKKIDKKLAKNASREMKLTVVSIFAVTIVMISSAYAIFSSVQKSATYNTLTVGTLKIDFADTDTGMGNIINLNGAYPESDADGQAESPYTFKITNSGTLNAKYVIKILDDTDMISSDNCQDNLLDKSKIRVSVNGDTPITLSDTEANGYIINNGTIATSDSKTFKIRIWISDTAGNEVLGKHYHGKIVVETENTSANKNILSVLTYNETAGADNYCVTGEEATCQESSCHKSNDKSSCPAGTIVKYNVDGTNEKFFYVLHDDGGKLTLQQRENTVNNVAWYANSADTTKGPITVLPQLESATITWSNVNDVTYEMGTTVFNDNSFTGCDNYTTCSKNIYTLPERTAKSRMISIQEFSKINCTNKETCPIWLKNYLTNSTSNGGIINDNVNANNYGYWTITANSLNPSYVHTFDFGGSSAANSTDYGARAVIEITK